MLNRENNIKCHPQCGNEFIGYHDDGVMMNELGHIKHVPWKEVEEQFGLIDHGITFEQFIQFLKKIPSR
jgi:hypothetical protein